MRIREKRAVQDSLKAAPRPPSFADAGFQTSLDGHLLASGERLRQSEPPSVFPPAARLVQERRAPPAPRLSRATWCSRMMLLRQPPALGTMRRSKLCLPNNRGVNPPNRRRPQGPAWRRGRRGLSPVGQGGLLRCCLVGAARGSHLPASADQRRRSAPASSTTSTATWPSGSRGCSRTSGYLALGLQAPAPPAPHNEFLSAEHDVLTELPTVRDPLARLRSRGRWRPCVTIARLLL